MKITAKLLREWGACWSDEKINDKMGERRGVSPKQIAADETVSLDDRLWVLCRALAHLDESAARRFAVESAQLVAHLAGDEDDQAYFLGICNSILQIEDLPLEQRDAARAAARAAAWAAARAAAWAAAWGAARAAAWDAAWDAARAAARDAARAAAWAAARAAELRKVIARAIEFLGDEA